VTDTEVFIQQIITGLSNGMIIALIALGYTLVYGIIELINFAHGDLVMLGAFLALTLVGMLGVEAVPAGSSESILALLLLFVCVPAFCACVALLTDKFAYRPLRNASKLSALVSAIGVSFIFINIGLFWGGVPMQVFDMGRSAASPKDFPSLLSGVNLLGDSALQFSLKDLMVFVVTLPALALLTYWVKFTKQGKAMRAVAQNPVAAKLMGIDVDRVIGTTFAVGGALGGVASVVYALYNNTVYFQMGYRVGMDAFTAAVLGGIGNLPGAMLGGILIGVVRAMGDQYVATMWTNALVFSILILVILFRPSGILGAHVREKV